MRTRALGDALRHFKKTRGKPGYYSCVETRWLNLLKLNIVPTGQQLNCLQHVLVSPCMCTSASVCVCVRGVHVLVYVYPFLPFITQLSWCSKSDIPGAVFQIHEVHCRKHMVLCDICDDPIPIREKEEHFKEYHAPALCELCGMSVPTGTLNEHKVSW